MTQSGPVGQDPTPPPGGAAWGEGGGSGGVPSGLQMKNVVVEKGPAPGVEYAELPIRIGAYIIDMVLLFVAYFIVATVIIAVLLFTGFWFIAWVVTALLYAAGSAIYFIWSWRNLRASPGQKVLSLETVNAATGKAISMDQAVKRYLYLFGPALLAQVFSFGGFGFAILGMLVGLAAFAYTIWLLYTVSQSPKRQGYHDVQASTVVIRRFAVTS
jgi:uncharacterized RDD family membrane protein YckC